MTRKETTFWSEELDEWVMLFSRSQVRTILEFMDREEPRNQPETRLWEGLRMWLALDNKALIKEIERFRIGINEEDEIFLTKMLLWRQYLGEISLDIRVPMDFIEYGTRITRWKVLLGWGGICEAPWPENVEIESYKSLVDIYLGAFREGRIDELEESYALLVYGLSVVGPVAGRYGWSEDAFELCDYVAKNYGSDPLLQWINFTEFCFLVLDTGYPWEKARPAWEFFVENVMSSGPSFPGWWLGYEAYGDEVLPSIRRSAHCQLEEWENLLSMARFPREWPVHVKKGGDA